MGHRTRQAVRHLLHAAIVGFVCHFLAATAAAAPIVVTPTSTPPDLFLNFGGDADITITKPREGAGSAELEGGGSYVVLEYGAGSGQSFGTWGDLESLGFDYYAPLVKSGLQLALRLDYYGSPSTFFVEFPSALDVTADWSTRVFAPADGKAAPEGKGGYVPATIDPNTPIVGIHIRGSGNAGFADLPFLNFVNGPDVAFNFEPAAVPEPSVLALTMAGAALAWRRRQRRG